MPAEMDVWVNVKATFMLNAALNGKLILVRKELKNEPNAKGENGKCS